MKSLSEIPSILYEMPDLSGFKGYDKKLAKRICRRIILRTRLSEAQNHRCAYCSSLTNADAPNRLKATLEHIIPEGEGGPTNEENCVMACHSCNHKRGATKVYNFVRNIGHKEWAVHTRYMYLKLKKECNVITQTTEIRIDSSPKMAG